MSGLVSNIAADHLLDALRDIERHPAATEHIRRTARAGILEYTLQRMFAEPIDTAPKDGRRIMLFGRLSTMKEPTSDFVWCSGFYNGDEYDPDFWCVYNNWQDYETRIVDPTHWAEMPIDPRK